MCSMAVAADGDPVKAPYVEVGDCWGYRAENLFYGRTEIRNYELCITHVDKTTDVILAVATVRDDGREIDLSFNSDWGSSTSITGQITTPSARVLKFPLRVGAKYSDAYQFRNAPLGGIAGDAQFEYEVIGWEEVTVPAGKFRALKIVGRGLITRYDVTVNPYGRTTRTVWYAPEVNRHIRQTYQDLRGISWSEELTGYRLNK